MGDRAADGTSEAAAERFQDLVLRHRGRTGLTQQQLAQRLGVHRRSIQAWEGGISYPEAEHLQALIAAFLQAGGLASGQETPQAEALWEAALREAPRLRASFDRTWFVALLTRQEPTPPAVDLRAAPPAPAGSRPAGARRQDWGEAPEAGGFRGRAAELETLRRWVLAERCRVVALLGLGGIGKTMLVARLAHALAPAFDRVYWRSLRNAPSPGEWLAGAIGFVGAERAPSPPGVAAQLTLLLELLREQRCLLVLDNFETVLQPGDRQGRYREGYADYGTLLERLGESEHRSSLLLTSREAPAELGPLAGEVAPVRVVALAGLATDDGRALLHDKGLSGDAGAWAALVGRYGGNGLALKILGETIRGLFGGDIAAFLRYATATYGATFGGLRRLLEAQTDRLSALEHTVLRGLAVAREPVTFPELAAALGPAVAPGAALEAVDALRRRSLLEQGARAAAFTLQPVVLEYVTEQLVEAASEEIVGGRADVLVGQPLLQATAKDYVRRSQERLILAPLLERLVGTAGSAPAGADRLLHLLGTWRDRAAAEQGYGPENAVNLLRLLQGHLRRADLSGLRIRQAYLQEVEMQDASLAGAHLSETVLGETFGGVSALAVSADGARIAAGTLGGEVRAWRVADRAPLGAVRGPLGAVPGVALSADGRLLASGSHDGTARLWEAEGGRPLATLRGHVGAVWGVALAADGHLVASGGLDGTVRLWEAAGGRPLTILDGHVGAVFGVALSADGRLVAGGGHDGTARLWAVAGGREVAVLTGHGAAVLGIAFRPDGRLLASGSLDGTVKLWDIHPLPSSTRCARTAATKGWTSRASPASRPPSGTCWARSAPTSWATASPDPEGGPAGAGVRGALGHLHRERRHKLPRGAGSGVRVRRGGTAPLE